MTSRIILIRHGETQENASGILQGHSHGALSELGKKQACAVAERLRTEQIDAVYSSDLRRALDTAGILTKHCGAFPNVVTDSRLREQNFGIHEKKPVFSMVRQMLRQKTDFGSFVPEKGESPNIFKQRIMELFEDILLKHAGETVVLVTHAGVIKALLESLFHNIFDEKDHENSFHNAAITIIEIDISGERPDAQSIACLEEANSVPRILRGKEHRWKR